MAGITDEDALANGWVITYDPFGTKLYQAPDGYVYNADAGDAAPVPVGNVNRASSGDSQGFNFWTSAQDLLTKGMSVYQLNQQQRAFNDVNKTRAAQGMAPLPWSSFTPTASVGLTADPKILYTLLGIGLVIAVAIFGGKRR